MHFIIVFSFALIGCATAAPGRIIGGNNITIEKHPYQASLQLKLDSGNYTHHCGASIISTKFLLTAAICYPEFKLSKLYARIGTTTVLEGGTVLKVDKFIMHPEFNWFIQDYDFAIVSFASDVEIVLGPKIQIVQLSRGEDPEVNSTVTVSGWGNIDSSTNSKPSTLQEVDLPVWDNKRCKVVYFYLTASQICFGGTSEGGTGACKGDGGAPVVQGSPYVQYGLFSGSYSCSDPNVPGVYARISAALPWIKELTGV